jgi:membrane associated rhomboid family serine protease
MSYDLQPAIVETYLSGPPRKESAVVAVLSIAIVFLFSFVYWQNSFGLSDYLIAGRDDVIAHQQYWRVFTSILIHHDVNHFLSNAMGLFLFSYLLFGYFGAFVYPVASFVLGAVVNLLSLITYPPGTQLLGASGVVYLMSSFWLVLFVLIERRFSLTKRLLRSIGFALVMLLSSSFDPAVSYRTHLIGFLIGLGFGVGYFLQAKQRIRASEIFDSEDLA